MSNMEMLNSLQVLAGKISPACDLKKSSMNISNIKQEVPDNDAIKMFVGQLPRSMDEDELKEMFEEFGPVHDINVLRDKASGVSKGCCFVTYYRRSSAVAAQNALHNVKSLPGMHHPIQMKPADTENRNDRKLFVGMVCKKLSEDNIRNMFDKFGSIEECTILRDNNGISKGCAFVTFLSRPMAIVAIKAMHHSQTMEGCSSPLVVKFADTQKDKEAKKVQQLQANLWGNLITPQYLPSANLHPDAISGSALTTSFPHQMTPLANQLAGSLLGIPGISNQLTSLNQLNGLSNPTNPGLLVSSGLDVSRLQGQPLQGLFNIQTSNTPNLDMGTYYLQGGPLQSVYTPGQTGLLNSAAAYYPSTFLPQIGLPGSSLLGNLSGANQRATLLEIPQTSEVPQTQNNLSSYYNGSKTSRDSSGSDISGLDNGLYSKDKTPNKAQAGSKQHEGPEGANLFIYHLPQDLTDADLHQSFQPYGNIISAKVFIDKQTNLSKCFGFVSYDQPSSATAAIQAMNGFQIGSKRLKVQLKRSKEASKPY